MKPRLECKRDYFLLKPMNIAMFDYRSNFYKLFRICAMHSTCLGHHTIYFRMFWKVWCNIKEMCGIYYTHKRDPMEREKGFKRKIKFSFFTTSSCWCFS